MHAIWSGSLSFGLVNIPVKLYSAVDQAALDFDLFRKQDYSRIHFKRIAEADGEEVAYEDLIRGFQFKKGQYVFLTEADINKTNAAKTQTIEILEFVEESDIDSIYFEKPYYLEPAQNSQKAYSILAAALSDTSKVGIAKFVLRNREHLAVVKSDGTALILNQMRFAEEIRPMDELKVPREAKYKKQELDIAIAIIDKLTTRYNPTAYHDTYNEELLQLIEKKAKGKRIYAKGKAPEPTKVVNLMDALRKSLDKLEKSG